MKAEDIISQLKSILPIYTDYFSDTLGVTSITSAALVATVTTTAAHNLETGDEVLISGALIPNEVATLTSADEVASLETISNHDQTQGYVQPVPTVNIIGANEAEYNGEHNLLTVPNRKTLTYEIDSGAPAAATGTIYLLENLRVNSYNGYHAITVTSPTEFTFPLERAIASPAYGDIQLKTNFRISGDITLDECIRAYTAQTANRLWAFVVLEDILANKDRSEDTDATVMLPNSNTEYRQLAIQQFHVYIFLPTTTRLSARYARDLCDDLLIAFNKSLLRFKPSAPAFEAVYSGAVFVKSGAAEYDTAYYVHDIVYETTFSITYNDTLDNDTSFAFRDISLKYELSISDDGSISREGLANLDDVLPD